eukprot:CAMPEP_0113566810 /NCGR_PEP_ID=MMETSP0015_2-20120614/22927_1 /TAXON_ID=2838 /ORGANISM="Odontella" /LENGTH=366 /DNA_ID=CAMNT_0000469135 /DNA_START=145 /DNA_END=1243 /DNA_ORIENTATION=+ /assembly_acc=CAM_ASM_000160
MVVTDAFHNGAGMHPPSEIHPQRSIILLPPIQPLLALHRIPARRLQPVRIAPSRPIQTRDVAPVPPAVQVYHVPVREALRERGRSSDLLDGAILVGGRHYFAAAGIEPPLPSVVARAGILLLRRRRSKCSVVEEASSVEVRVRAGISDYGAKKFGLARAGRSLLRHHRPRRRRRRAEAVSTPPPLPHFDAGQEGPPLHELPSWGYQLRREFSGGRASPSSSSTTTTPRGGGVDSSAAPNFNAGQEGPPLHELPPAGVAGDGDALQIREPIRVAQSARQPIHGIERADSCSRGGGRGVRAVPPRAELVTVAAPSHRKDVVCSQDDLSVGRIQKPRGDDEDGERVVIGLEGRGGSTGTEIIVGIAPHS